jgi:uncharacterized protein (TIGR00251 family)
MPSGAAVPPDFVSEAGDCCVLRVKVTPGASKNALHDVRAGRLRVQIAAAPEKGKANAALIAFLAQTLGLPKSQITLTAGEKSRDKTLRLPASALEKLTGIV